jgi:predicted ATPase
MVNDPSKTQRDAGYAVAAELRAFGLADAEEIGRGGFGIVYRCTETALDRVVAVKVLTGEMDDDRQRFIREQRAMGRLSDHPHIVAVLSVGETESGYPYLVMEYHKRGSLDNRIRRHGALPLQEVLQLGIKMAGALQTAHLIGVLHRDVKPGNILLTDYGEPALTDFGIAHIPGGFTTASGTFTGSPAFTAPEVLGGEVPTTASDVYSLGATLFCALTGHAAFERRSGEQVVTQFLRIATEAAPDLRESGVPEDVSAAVASAMSRHPRDRPFVVELAEELQQIQRNHGFPVDQMALRATSSTQPPAESVGGERASGNLPLELTSFVGRSTDLLRLKEMLTRSRLATLTGIGGVGKTRLALRAAAEVRTEFRDGAWLVALDELRDPSLLIDVVAAALGLRDKPGRPLTDVVIEFLSASELLLVLDNCEQVIDAVATFVESVLGVCADVRILATSREPLGVAGESVLPLLPLACPDVESEPTLHGLSEYDAVALFAERAAGAVPGFELNEENKDIVARICSRLDGLPLGIELATARLKAMTPRQILDRLSTRYTLLSGGRRHAPARQRTLSWSIAWSYDLCTTAEQQLWERLSVFAGSFGLDAAEEICGTGLDADELVDLLSSLVDKSILVRIDAGGVVRFRLLQALRAFGRDKIEQTGEYHELRQRHHDWYHNLVVGAEAEWFGPRQLWWFHRVEAELPNLREALDFSLSQGGVTALRTAAALVPFWTTRGLFSEGRRLLDRALLEAPPDHTTTRAKALYAATILAAVLGDMPAARARVTEARALAEELTDPSARAYVLIADGFTALLDGDLERSLIALEPAVQATSDLDALSVGLMNLGWAHELSGRPEQALPWYEKALALSVSHGESVYRTNALWSIGVAKWQLNEREGAADRLREGLQLARVTDDARVAAVCLEALAWIAMEDGDARYAVVLMGAAESMFRAVGTAMLRLPDLTDHHRSCEDLARKALGETEYDAARREGGSLTFGAAVDFALAGHRG